MRYLRFILLSLSLMLFPCMVFSQVEEVAELLPTADEELFDQLDGNWDGWLSGIELGTARVYDLDGNGEVTRIEFLSGRANDRLRIQEGSILEEDILFFHQMDSAQSGYLSGTDIRNAEAERFDVDFDGRVTRNEFLAGRALERKLAEEKARRLQAAKEAEDERRRAANEAVEAPPLNQVLVSKKGFMIGRVLTVEGNPLPSFTIEFAGYDIATQSLNTLNGDEPNLIGRVKGKDGYYEIRLPEGSFGFVASVIIPMADGFRRFPLRAEDEGNSQLDYVEVTRRHEGVIKNLIWGFSLDDLNDDGM
ncbi:MAG: hypothetical protein JKY51_05945 [Opitutaceae bacterium]|nr:hypothetical protein [Opitutaceae bacterium]